MNSNEPADAGLEALLRNSAPAPLSDSGFASRVLASLPPAQRIPAAPWWRLQVALIAVGAAAGLVAALSMISSLDAGISLATGTLGNVLSEPGAILALGAIAVVWALASGDEAVN
jgi:hypothetical protein